MYDFCQQPVEDSMLAWPALPPRLSLLCAADCRGQVSIFASSLFPLARVDVAALAARADGPAPAAAVRILQVCALASIHHQQIPVSFLRGCSWTPTSAILTSILAGSAFTTGVP